MLCNIWIADSLGIYFALVFSCPGESTFCVVDFLKQKCGQSMWQLGNGIRSNWYDPDVSRTTLRATAVCFCFYFDWNIFFFFFKPLKLENHQVQFQVIFFSWPMSHFVDCFFFREFHLDCHSFSSKKHHLSQSAVSNCLSYCIALGCLSYWREKPF